MTIEIYNQSFTKLGEIPVAKGYSFDYVCKNARTQYNKSVLAVTNNLNFDAHHLKVVGKEKVSGWL